MSGTLRDMLEDPPPIDVVTIPTNSFIMVGHPLTQLLHSGKPPPVTQQLHNGRSPSQSTASEL